MDGAPGLVEDTDDLVEGAARVADGLSWRMMVGWGFRLQAAIWRL
jgi:hypothetical protein